MGRPRKNPDPAAAMRSAARALKSLATTPTDTRPKPRRTLGASLALDRERRPEAVITLPIVTEGTVTDTDVGLPDDPVSQLRAETYLKAAIAFRMREDDKARQLARAAALAVPANMPIVHVEVPDEALVLIDPTDRLSPDDAAILAELQRLAGRQHADDRRPTGA